MCECVCVGSNWWHGVQRLTMPPAVQGKEVGPVPLSFSKCFHRGPTHLEEHLTYVIKAAFPLARFTAGDEPRGWGLSCCIEASFSTRATRPCATVFFFNFVPDVALLLICLHSQVHCL